MPCMGVASKAPDLCRDRKAQTPFTEKVPLPVMSGNQTEPRFVHAVSTIFTFKSRLSNTLKAEQCSLLRYRQA